MAETDTLKVPWFVLSAAPGRTVRPPLIFGGLGAANAPPEVSAFQPPPGSIIQPSTALQFDVRDDGTVRRYYVAASFGGHAIREVVHDGRGFAPLYSGSTRVPLVELGREVGSRFVVRRVGDWPASPRLHIEAVDDGGNVSVLL